MIAEVRGSVNKDINGAELLYSLLNAPWLQSLLKVESILHTPTNSQGSSPPVRVHLLLFSLQVYECLQRHLKGPARPYLSYSSGLSLQVNFILTALHF